MPGLVGSGTRYISTHIYILLLFVLFCVLFVCKCVLPSGDDPIAVNIYIYIWIQSDHSSRGVLPTVVRRWVWSRNHKNEEAVTQVGLKRHKKKKIYIYMHIQAELSPFWFFFVQRCVWNKQRRHNSDGVVTRILVLRRRNCSIPGRSKWFFFCSKRPDRLLGSPNLLFSKYWCTFPWG